MKHTSNLARAFALFLFVLSCTLPARAQEPKPDPARAGDEAAVRENVKSMETGWNTKSGATFAKPFAEDADYVIVNGTHIQGKTAIDKGHQQIFDTIYKNSTLALTVKQVRFLRPDVALAHVAARMKVGDGPAKGEWDALISMVMLKDPGGWKIASFQNTPVQPPQGR
ncbi:MAG TPA: SgcJ/EcaC family oxidoreductase [Pyrinomonadaceae bacterium]|nr:SgcJ/EcaC family oxidoreductase [Pyrinomonadaceae bacterium]